MQTYIIDAENKKLGRVASEAAKLLMGKDRTDFVRNAAPNVVVTVVNASKLAIDERKLIQKKYSKYSGYPGGLRFETLEHALNKKGVGEVLRKTVYGMLPTNKLRVSMIKRLKIQE